MVSVTSLLQFSPVFADGIKITADKSGVFTTGYFEAVNKNGRTVRRREGFNFNRIHVNGVLAFCIEPEITRGKGEGYSVSNFSHKDREMFSRIIYHGFDNTSKTSKVYVITQSTL